MLILSRRANERIDFPGLGISVEVMRIENKKVRLGISAPKELRVIRHELAGSEPSPLQPSNPDSADAAHDFRNQLNEAVLGLHLLQRQMESGQVEDSEAAVADVLLKLGALETMLSRLLNAQAAGGSSPEPHVLPKRRVLLVDDSRNEAALLAGYLRSFDFAVDVAHDGIEAIEYLRGNEKPDVILLDMQMPRLDGAGTIRWIRDNPALDGIRVFAVSGMDASEAAVSIGSDGVDGWFSKPLTLKRLLDAIRRDAQVPA